MKLILPQDNCKFAKKIIVDKYMCVCLYMYIDVYIQLEDWGVI